MISIAMVSDTHGWGPPNIGPADIWLHAGDIKDQGKMFPIDPWEKLPMKIVHGNHDCGKMPPRLQFIDGDVVEARKGLWIAGIGWTGEKFYELPLERDIQEVCSKITSNLNRLWMTGRMDKKDGIILLSHYPPLSVMKDFGFESIDRLINQIDFDLIVCGHLHDYAGMTFGNIVFPGPDGRVMCFEERGDECSIKIPQRF